MELDRRKRLASLPFSEKIRILEKLPRPQSDDCCQRLEERSRPSANAQGSGRQEPTGSVAHCSLDSPWR